MQAEEGSVEFQREQATTGKRSNIELHRRILVLYSISS